MVLCKFFQQGTCRFGSKCVNEHLDVKHMIKTDVEGAINGKQWPLSTYGPFKDRPSIPNFIEDQSFEEVRMLCYEAKQKNFFDQFHQQFNKEALEARNKMKALLQMTPDIVDVLISVYDSISDTSSSDVTIEKATNGRQGLAHSAASSGVSIFAKPTTNTSANNMFVTNNSTFTATNQGSTGIFTNASAFAGQQQQQQGSIFGQQTKPANSTFGVGNNSNTQQNTSIFAQQQAQSNPFTTSIPQPSTLSVTGLFSHQNQFLQQPHQSSNIFRQASQVSQPQQGMFAPAAQQMQQQPNQQVLFAQGAQQTPAGQGIFSQAAQQTQSIFSQAFQHQQHTNQNIFQQNVPNSGSYQQQINSNIFQQNQSITAQQPPSGLFQQAALQTQNTGGQINQPTHVNSALYSRLEDLTADEIEAFKADCFLPGKLPFNPPPRELIN